MTYLAHSKGVAGIAQPYEEHVRNVRHTAVKNITAALAYAPSECREFIRDSVELAAEFHDLGKLEDSNQAVLRGDESAKHLEFPHEDAGVARILQLGDDASWAACLSYSHHRGLPDFSDISVQPSPFRDDRVASRSDDLLDELLRRHAVSVGRQSCKTPKGMPCGLSASLLRVMYGCLTDADHLDTAHAKDGVERSVSIELKPRERLLRLERYVEGRAKDFSSKIKFDEQRSRGQARAEFYKACASSNSRSEGSVEYCDAPVGSGKTTAVMARLLSVAEKRGLRRVIVVLPFTNIIAQSVKVYREALCLPDENPRQVVAELHHLADFDDVRSRHLTPLWDAPIIVTTAVAFFETLASNRSSTLRRLSSLPGSAIFLDEAHAMLPLRFLPIALLWITAFSKGWGCYWILGSGSLVRFWEYKEVRRVAECDIERVENIVDEPVTRVLMKNENRRVEYGYKKGLQEIDEVCQWISSLPGPIIVVVNTIVNAARIARELRQQKYFDDNDVYHLSTALSPADREKTIEKVKSRLMKMGDDRWCLIATSCVEAGVDFSFRTGVRECASILSLLQLAGRVNRNSEYHNSKVWTFCLKSEKWGFTENPVYERSSRILIEQFENGANISPELCTELVKKELRENIKGIDEELCKSEMALEFSTVAREFRVIKEDTVTVVVDPVLKKAIEAFEQVDWRDVQRGSVTMRRTQADKLGVPQSSRYPGLYIWHLEYDEILGYAVAVLKIADLNRTGYCQV